MHPLNPIGKLLDYFKKIEVQKRGTVHAHLANWIEGAPKYGVNTDKEICDFVDKYITCAIPDVLDERTEQLISYQTHKHSATCKKGRRNVCRFNFPKPPMRNTMILYPLEDGEPNEVHVENWKRIKSILDDICPTFTFDEFLQFIELDEASYLLAIRSSLCNKAIFYRRKPAEIRINTYNDFVLRAWGANMDIQFVLDPCACAMYMVSYITKSQRGMSNLLSNAVREARLGNLDVRNQARKIGNAFLNHVEISAQEAVYILLQLHLKESSRLVIFINTSPKENRVILLKSQADLEQLEDDDEDIECDSTIKRYMRRPSQMEDVCLADFVSLYTVVPKSSSGNRTALSLTSGEKIRKRKRQAVIRYVRFSKEKDSENHFREILMLFHPWRDEDQIIDTCDSYEERFTQLTSENTSIRDKMQEYNHYSRELDEAEEEMRNRNEDDRELLQNRMAPSTQHANLNDELDAVDDINPDLAIYEAPTGADADIGLDLGLPATNSESITATYEMGQAEYLDLMRTLNVKQREFLLHVLHYIKTDQEHPLHNFLSGGAGVGKSQVVKAIYQSLIRYFNTRAGSNPDDSKIILSALTGKAAFLIKGKTLHSIFGIIPNKGYLEYKSLTADKLNTLRVQFKNVELLIVDEISMVGADMNDYIDRRLQQIFGNQKPYGGIHVITVGDLFQLMPIFDRWIFKNSETGCGSLAPNLWTEHFKMFELDEIMRQKGKEFAQLLNRLREGKQTLQDIDLLKTRIVDPTSEEYDINAQHIFLVNDQVNQHNTQIAQRSRSAGSAIIRCTDTVIGDVSNDVKEICLQKAEKAKLSTTSNLMFRLEAVVGVKYDIATNVDIEDGILNGASCMIRRITPTHIWVEFDEPEIGVQCRNSNRHLYNRNDISSAWTPIFRIKRQFSVGRKAVYVMRCQYPLRMSAAKTAHRTQGSTFEKLVVDLSGKKVFHHAHYVALSRVTSLENLQILSLNEQKIIKCKDVINEMERLRTHCKVQLCITPLYTIQAKLKVLFHNVQSLNCHFKDVIADKNYAAADILMFAETKLHASDADHSLKIPGFADPIRFDWEFPYSTPRPTYGLCIYVKESINIAYHEYQSSNAPNLMYQVATFTVTNMSTEDVTIACVYSKPKNNETLLRQELHNLLLPCFDDRTLIMGDFNVDLKKKPVVFSNIPQVVTQVTTNERTLIDHIYTNIPTNEYTTGVYESYFSYHKPVWLCVT